MLFEAGKKISGPLMWPFVVTCATVALLFNPLLNAIGIWLKKELAGEIQFSGSYHAKGDRVEIIGVFHRGCIQHGGDMDIHAQNIRKVDPDRLVREDSDTGKRNFTFILLGVLSLVLIFVHQRRSKESEFRTG